MSVVFVFGSNLAGRHGAGAARHAAQSWGAQYGVGEGRTGDAYALPTMDHHIRPLPLDQIARRAETFLAHARAHPGDSFLLTAVACGLGGKHPSDIAPLFSGAPENVFCRLSWSTGWAGRRRIPGWRRSEMSDWAGEIAYNRALYAKSPKERLRRINYDRARRGSPLLASLDDARLRIPMPK